MFLTAFMILSEPFAFDETAISVTLTVPYTNFAKEFKDFKILVFMFLRLNLEIDRAHCDLNRVGCWLVGNVLLFRDSTTRF